MTQEEFMESMPETLLWETCGKETSSTAHTVLPWAAGGLTKPPSLLQGAQKDTQGCVPQGDSPGAWPS